MNKIKSSSFILIFCCLSLTGCAKSVCNEVLQMRDAFSKLQAESTYETQEKFFLTFPKNWLEFIVFDHEMNDHYKEDFQPYVEAFGTLTHVNDTLYCRKLLGLVRGADLDADAPGALHKILHQTMGDKSYTNGEAKTCRSLIMLWLLSHELEGDIMRFWQFYWSSLYFEEDNGASNNYNFTPEYLRLHDVVSSQYPDMLDIMTTAFKYFHHGVIFLFDYSTTY